MMNVLKRSAYGAACSSCSREIATMSASIVPSSAAVRFFPVAWTIVRSGRHFGTSTGHTISATRGGAETRAGR